MLPKGILEASRISIADPASSKKRILEQAEGFLQGRPIAEVPPEYEDGLRRLMTADGVHNYFWKARPAR